MTRTSDAARSRSPFIPRGSSTFFFFNDTATTEIYTLSLHDALPIYVWQDAPVANLKGGLAVALEPRTADRKSTRLNSSHLVISYAVFCLKKKDSSVHIQMICHTLRYRPPWYKSYTLPVDSH